MTDLDAVEQTGRDYDRIADEYDDLVRHSPDFADPLQEAMISAFGDLVAASACEPSAGGRPEVLDAGCGPGHWTDHLDRRGVRARGIDLSPAMIALARGHRPDLRFETGSVLEIAAADASVDGVLAHFSLIHLPPSLLPAALAEFARVTRPGGHLLLAGQITDTAGGEGWVPYDHRASPAYLWTLDALAARLRDHGFDELARLRIAPPPHKRTPAGYLLARRPC